MRSKLQVTMSSFLQSVRSAYGNKETVIKDSITTQLSENVKEIQLCSMNENLSGTLLCYSVVLNSFLFANPSTKYLLPQTPS